MTDDEKALVFEDPDDPAKDILAWAAERALWIQDALRRLAQSERLSKADRNELVAMIRKEHGLAVKSPPPSPIPLIAYHLGPRGSTGFSDTRILGIQDIRHVGRMAGGETLLFGRDGLSAIYGDNGAGKSGYTRIFRRVGSGRGDDLKKKILPDVFAEGPAGEARAEIKVERGGAVTQFCWCASNPNAHIPGLCVFDSDATHAYVDAGNAIELLPFNIDIILRLREFCDDARSEFEAEKQTIDDQWQESYPDLPKDTHAENIVQNLSADTTANEIEEFGVLRPERMERFEALSSLVAVPRERLKTLTSLLPIIESAAPVLAAAEALLEDDALEGILSLDREATRLWQAAADADTHLLEGHDLPVGNPAWKKMWEAAREFSETLVHPGHVFPNTQSQARCPLCQQELDDIARIRLLRLEDYVSSKLRKEADNAASLALTRKAELDEKIKAAEDALSKLDLSKENKSLATDLSIWLPAAKARRASLDQWLNGKGCLAPSPIKVAARLANMVATVSDDMANFVAGDNVREAKAVVDEFRELQAWLELGQHKREILARVQDLVRIKKLDACIASTSSTAVTRFFNALKDRYLSDTLLRAYNKEISSLNLNRLKVTVTPKNARDSAKFLIDLKGRKHTTSKLSEILSEGERSALSLAAFLAEQSIGGGAGSLVFDDPVSSLDHEWATMIAKRLAEEAKKRQIIVFTHDLVFYDMLCTATDRAKVPISFQRLFRRNDSGTSGHVDPVPSNWKSQKVKDRISHLKPLIKAARSKANISPDDYEFDTKGIYGRMRDTWERLVEELLFHKVVQRFQKGVSTSELRYLTADPEILERIEMAMTRTSTFSHDNAVATDQIPQPDELDADMKELEEVTELIVQHHKDIDNSKKKK